MSRFRIVLVALSVVPLVAAGCGGSDGTTPPPPNTAGQITGRILGVSDPTAYQITVDGRPVNVRPNPNGTFTIPGVPPGSHTIGCIGPGGMRGAYAHVRVRRRRTANVGDLSPEVGGQIAGMVTRVLTDGSLEPVANVEVVATSAVVWALVPASAAPISVGRGGDEQDIVIRAFTDKNGSYLMQAVPPGGYDVSVIIPGSQPDIQYVWVDAGRTSVADFMLYPAPEQGVGTVEGIVTGEGAGPLEGAEITVTTDYPWPVPLPTPVVQALARSHLDAGLIAPPSDPSHPGRGGGAVPGGPGDPIVMPPIEVRIFKTLSDSQGHYSLNVPVGRHWIECWLDGWEWQDDEILIEKNKVLTKNFHLQKSDNRPVPPPVPGPTPLASAK